MFLLPFCNSGFIFLQLRIPCLLVRFCAARLSYITLQVEIAKDGLDEILTGSLLAQYVYCTVHEADLLSLFIRAGSPLRFTCSWPLESVTIFINAGFCLIAVLAMGAVLRPYCRML